MKGEMIPRITLVPSRTGVCSTCMGTDGVRDLMFHRTDPTPPCNGSGTIVALCANCQQATINALNGDAALGCRGGIGASAPMPMSPAEVADLVRRARDVRPRV